MPWSLPVWYRHHCRFVSKATTCDARTMLARDSVRRKFAPAESPLKPAVESNSLESVDDHTTSAGCAFHCHPCVGSLASPHRILSRRQPPMWKLRQRGQPMSTVSAAASAGSWPSLFEGCNDDDRREMGMAIDHFDSRRFARDSYQIHTSFLLWLILLDVAQFYPHPQSDLSIPFSFCSNRFLKKQKRESHPIKSTLIFFPQNHIFYSTPWYDTSCANTTKRIYIYLIFCVLKRFLRSRTRGKVKSFC